MLPCAIFLFPLLLCAAVNTQPSDPIISLNCGGASSSIDGRTWQPDSPSKYLSSASQNSSAAHATQQHPSISSDGPFMTARISTSILAYAFPLPPGPKFLRLFFYPALYSSSPSTFNAYDSFFSVSANNFTLLRNFSASLHLLDSAPKRGVAYLIKEFVVTVLQNQTLHLTFTPSPSSLAFINGIEIAPIPENLYIKDKDHPYTLVNYEGQYFYFDSPTALETIFRLNVGGGGGGDGDTGMFRSWEDDTDYLYGDPGMVPSNPLGAGAIKYTVTTPSYTAPEIVYQTVRSMGRDPHYNLRYNLTWVFSVDSGFDYLVRLHFCETDKFVNASFKQVFSIFINNFTAVGQFDVFHSAGANNVPIYLDCVVKVPPESEAKQGLWLALHPLSDAIFANAILNGVEIFKLNNSDGNLSGLNPEPEQHPVPKEGAHTDKKSVVLPVVGAAVGAVLILSLAVLFIVHRRKAKQETASIHHKSTSNSTDTAASALLLLPTDLCHRYSMPEIRAATRNFIEESVLGSGGFGTVYKGFIGSVPVAVKRLDSLSKQGVREFHTEIQMLSKLRHAHLVSLIGYCDEEGEMILVYEFMECGNLQDHIYKAKKISLPWEKRLQICIGAAKGLHYLHTGGKHAIIHRDVKSSNILLDGNWVAKVSDFGLSKMGPTSESQTHVSTSVRGSFGYFDPEYYRRQQLTEKSDVYSFGVVLLEVVFARPPIVPTQTKEKINLVQWARKCYQSGMIYQDIDPHLTGDVQAASLNKYMEIAESCVRDKAVERPTMSDVIWALEFCLQLQVTTGEDVNAGDANKEESALKAYKEVISTNADNMFTSSSGPMESSRATISISDNSFGTDNSIGVSSENVFSEIFNPNGR